MNPYETPEQFKEKANYPSLFPTLFWGFAVLITGCASYFVCSSWNSGICSLLILLWTFLNGLLFVTEFESFYKQKIKMRKRVCSSKYQTRNPERPEV